MGHDSKTFDFDVARKKINEQLQVTNIQVRRYAKCEKTNEFFTLYCVIEQTDSEV